MKLKIAYINHILISVLLIIIAETVLYSQGIDKSKRTQPKLYIGINGGPSKNRIINEGTLSIAEMSSNSKNSICGSFELGYYFSKFIGLSTGIGCDSYSTELLLTSYSNTFSSTDSENETYERRVSGSDMKELQRISYLRIPFCINFQMPFGRRYGFFINTGINLSFPLRKKYNSSGTFTFTGYYPAYNVLLQDLPAYGFPSNSSISYNGSLDLKSNTIDGYACAGFQLFINRKIQIAIGAGYTRSLSTISNYTTADFQLASDIDKINSMMSGSSKTLTEAMGLRLSLRYYIK